VLTEVPAFKIDIGYTGERYQLVSVPVSNIALAAAAPVVTSSNALRIPAAVDIAFAAPVPTVGSGIGSFVSVPAAAITVAAVAPTTTTNGTLSDPDFASVSLLLHMDGSNGSTTFTDSSSNALTVTANGNAQISTAQSKFGGASGVFDGNNDWLSASDADLAFGTGNFTVECFVRWTGDTNAGNTAASNLVDFRTAEPSTQFSIYIAGSSAPSGLSQSYRYYVNGSDRIVSTTIATQNVWRHVALVRVSGTTAMYIDGTSQGTWTDTTNYTNTTCTIAGRFAALSGDQRSLNGYIDDLRITNGVARYTSDFTPPTTAFPNS